MNENILIILGTIPLVLLILMILKLRMPIHKAVLATLVMVVLVTGFALHTPWSNIGSALAFGALKGFWPITIVILTAIFSYNLMVETGKMEVLRTFLSGLSNDRRILALIIIWCFGGFLEGAAGFGTAVAIPISILMALGFDPFRAAVAALVADTVSTVFGAVGIPVSILAQTVHLPETDLSAEIMRQLGFFDLILPVLIVIIVGGGIKALKGVFLPALACGVATMLGQFVVARFLGPALVAFAGAVLGLAALLAVARFTEKTIPPEFQVRAPDASAQGQSYRPAQIWQAAAIYLLSFVFILACSPIFPAVRQAVTAIATTIPFPLTDGRTLNMTFDWVATPGMLILFASIVGGAIQGASPAAMVRVFARTVVQLRTSIVAISAIVAMSTLMDVSGLIVLIASPLIAAAGKSFMLLSPLIGALGSFVTGSVANANVLFGKLQLTAAQQLALDPVFLSAANASGASSKMINPQSISIALGAARMPGRDSELLAGTLRWFLLYMLLLEIRVGLSYLLPYF